MQVGVEDITFKGRLRTTMIPLMFEMPVVGALQVGDPAVFCLTPMRWPLSEHLTLQWPSCMRCLLAKEGVGRWVQHEKGLMLTFAKSVRGKHQ